jgi:hypothetical protein
VNIVTVSGNLVDCSGQPLADGYAKIQIDDVVVAAFTDANGAFEKEIFNCNNSATVAVTGYDLVNLLESATQNFNISGNTADAGDMEVCNALTEYIQVSLDGQNRTYIDPSGFLEAGNTYILASDSLVGFSYISLVFGNNGQTGNFSVGDLQIWPPGDTIDVLNVNTNVTSYGSVGEPIIGTFNGTYQSSNGTNRTVSGSYRVIRDQ